MTTHDIDKKYMARAIQLAANGAGFVSPNPQVGAVIVAPDGRIIGEGWHRIYGEAHAEVNAVRSVAPDDESLLSQSTIYVTLEPCSHYGKTPPCSLLLIEKKLKRVVVGTLDPFPEVSGRGIRMLREAGIEVTVGCLEKECREQNRRFMTAHTQQRPYIQLKWAESSNRKIAAINEHGEQQPVALSTPLSLVEMHHQRALADAILVGTQTIITDNPSLTVRHAPGRDPRPVIFSSERLPQDANILKRNPIILDPGKPLAENMKRLYTEHKITSLMVEGGAKIHNSFIAAELFDEIRIEQSPIEIEQGVDAPLITAPIRIVETHQIEENHITTYWKDVKKA